MKLHRKIIRLTQVRNRTGKATSTIYDQMQKGLFPKPVKLGPRAVGWVEDEVDAHVERLIASRDGAECSTRSDTEKFSALTISVRSSHNSKRDE